MTTARFLPSLALGALIVGAACEDPARPQPDFTGGGTVFVSSDPQGGEIYVDFEPTGEITPRLIAAPAGVQNIKIVLDTSGFTYSDSEYVNVAADVDDLEVFRPLSLRCTTMECLRESSQFHTANDIRFAVNGAGPAFLFEGRDLALAWPATTANSYAGIGMATMTGLVEGQAVALGVSNVGAMRNYWAGRPLPTVLSTEPYHVRIPAWITPPVSTPSTRIRGLQVVQEVIGHESLSGVLLVRVTWTNISADSLYRLLDPATPAAGVSYTDTWIGFILDADIGAFGEANDDLVSYSADRNLVYAYDSNFSVGGFSGGWSGQPGLVGLMAFADPGVTPRLNAWTAMDDFAAGVNDAEGRVTLTASQTTPGNHPDARIGYAPDDEDGEYMMSVAVGPFELAPGDSVSATFAVILAPPAAGTFAVGVPVPAGDPTDPTRPLEAIAAPLLELADDVIDAPET